MGGNGDELGMQRRGARLREGNLRTDRPLSLATSSRSGSRSQSQQQIAAEEANGGAQSGAEGSRGSHRRAPSSTQFAVEDDAFRNPVEALLPPLRILVAEDNKVSTLSQQSPPQSYRYQYTDDHCHILLAYIYTGTNDGWCHSGSELQSGDYLMWQKGVMMLGSLYWF